MSHNIQPIHILIAEDEETDAFFIEQAFGQSSVQNVVHWVKDGQEVMNFLSNSDDEEQPRPHMIILDINMPGKNGHDVLAEIKENPELCDIPVVMMSSSNKTEDVIQSYKHHANAYVPKSNGFQDMTDFVSAMEKFWFMQARLPGKAA